MNDMGNSRFFSVKHTTNIGGAGRFIPSVCYKLTQDIQAAVERMAAAGDAKLYNEEVRFVTGVAYPVKKPESSKPWPFATLPELTVSEPDSAGKAGKSGKTGKKKGSAGQRDFT
jgi:hypothetical protein